MKKLTFLPVLFALAVAGLFAQAAALPRLAVAEFTINNQSDSLKEVATAVRNMVQSHMAGLGRYRMVTFDEIDLLLRNQQIQASSISSAENIAKLQRTNVNYIVTGSVNVLFGEYTIIVSLLDIANGESPYSARETVAGSSREFNNGVTSLMDKFTGGMVTAGDRVTTNRTYNVGDFGPAGGYIFYDKGVFSGGWRYLEAAPAETEFRAQWGAYEQNVSGTADGVGFGKRNTGLIVEHLNQRGESGRAAQLCASLNFDGFNDWFLPSKDELNLMYRNLKQKGLGGFNSNDWYWASSQGNNNRAWTQHFRDGSLYNYTKDLTSLVRAVRAF